MDRPDLAIVGDGWAEAEGAGWEEGLECFARSGAVGGQGRAEGGQLLAGGGLRLGEEIAAHLREASGRGQVGFDLPDPG